MRAVVGDWIVTSTIRINQLRAVCNTLLLTPMENSQSHSEMTRNLWLKGPEGCCQRWRRLPSKFTLNPDLLETLHKPSMQNCDGLLGLSSAGLSKKMQTLSRVLVHNGLCSKSRRIAKLAQREDCSLPLLESIAQGFRLQPTASYCAVSTCTVVRSLWWGLRDVS